MQCVVNLCKVVYSKVVMEISEFLFIFVVFCPHVFKKEAFKNIHHSYANKFTGILEPSWNNAIVA